MVLVLSVLDHPLGCMKGGVKKLITSASPLMPSASDEHGPGKIQLIFAPLTA
jgi:hypothetical protein